IANHRTVAKLRPLHIAVARAGPARCVEGELQEARAIDPGPRLSTPKIGHAKKAFGDGDKVGRVPVPLGDMGRGHEPPVAEPGGGGGQGPGGQLWIGGGAAGGGFFGGGAGEKPGKGPPPPGGWPPGGPRTPPAGGGARRARRKGPPPPPPRR